MSSQNLFFKSHQGLRLAATLDLPKGKVVAYALMTHCFTCGRNFKSLYRISQVLNQHGIATLRFDHTGIGESEGNFEETRFTTYLDDTLAAVDFLKQNYQAPQVLLGHSLGGTTLLASVAKIPSAQAIIMLASPSNTLSLANLLVSESPQILTDGVGQVQMGSQTFVVKKDLIESLQNFDVESYIPQINQALLVLYPENDKTVKPSHAKKVFDLATTKHKNWIYLPKTTHLLLTPEEAKYAGDLIALWLQPYLLK